MPTTPAARSDVARPAFLQRHDVSSHHPTLKAFPGNSREGRLHALLHDFHLAHFAPWKSQLHQLELGFAKAKYWKTEEKKFLCNVYERCQTLMHNVRAAVEMAALEHTPLDDGLLRVALQTYDDVSAITDKISGWMGHDMDFAALSKNSANELRRKRQAAGSLSQRGVQTETVVKRCAASTPKLHEIRLMRREPEEKRVSTHVVPHALLRASKVCSGTTAELSCPPSHDYSTPTRSPQSHTDPHAGRSPLPVPATAGGGTDNFVSPLREEFTTSASKATTPRRSMLRGGNHTPASPFLHKPGDIPSASRETLSLATRRQLLDTIDAATTEMLAQGGAADQNLLALAKQSFMTLYGTRDGNRRFLQWCDETALLALRRGGGTTVVPLSTSF